MVSVAVSVEGTTEERFVKTTLAPHFSPLEIYLTPINIGGKVSIPRVSRELKRIAYNFDYVTTLYDFYGFHDKAINENKQSLETRILSSIDEPIRHRVLPYVQMYEFEALLFTSPQIMQNILQGHNIQRWGQSILNAFFNNPENINNSPHTAPSKRLIGHTNYKKTIHGPEIAKDIGLNALRSACPGFHAWLSSIENITTH